MSPRFLLSAERRSFLTRLQAGAAGLAALTVGHVARAQGKAGPKPRFEAQRHAQDDWMETTGATKLILKFTPTTAGTVDILTNDIVPGEGDIYSAPFLESN